jgi:hypothetical protein
MYITIHGTLSPHSANYDLSSYFIVAFQHRTNIQVTRKYGSSSSSLPDEGPDCFSLVTGRYVNPIKAH